MKCRLKEFHGNSDNKHYFRKDIIMIEYFNEDFISMKATNGTEFIISKEDYEFVCCHKWAISGNYLQSCIGGKRVWLHRMLLDAPKGFDVDHVDMNGLNNKRTNLRLCSRSENMRNSKSRLGTSKYKGVCWDVQANKWMAYINTAPYKRRHLGLYASELLAASAYNEAALKYHGEYARLNYV